MADKAATEFLKAIIREVQPPAGCAIAIRECEPNDMHDCNWVTGTGNLPPDALFRYETAIAELRRQNPRIDWEGVTEKEGKWRRKALFSSEVDEI